MAINYDQIIPKKVELEMDGPNGEDLVVKIGPFTLADEIWLKETYGERVKDIFAEMDVGPLARIAFRVMDSESRKNFPKKVYMTVDEEGNEVEETIGGYKLFAQCFKGVAKKVALLQALAESLGISRQMVEEAEDNLKKQTAQALNQ